MDDTGQVVLELIAGYADTWRLLLEYDKAAHLLYFVVKDHPYTGGNKYIGLFLFLLYLRH